MSVFEYDVESKTSHNNEEFPLAQYIIILKPVRVGQPSKPDINQHRCIINAFIHFIVYRLRLLPIEVVIYVSTLKVV